MRVAIAGSTGFLGGALAASLRDDDHEVVPIARPGSRARGVAWDPERGTIDAAGLEGTDAIVFLGGEPIGRRWTAERKRRIVSTRVDATVLLARTAASLARRPRVFVGSSASGYYGDRGAQVLEEDSGPGSGFLADVCRAWEEASAPAADAGIRVVSIRTGLVLDPGGGLLQRVLLPFRLGLGGRLGDGLQYQPWITLRDHVRAMRHLLDSDVWGPVNVVGPEPVTNAELTRALARAVRRPAVLPVPRAAIALVFGRELTMEFLASQRAVPSALGRAGFVFEHPDLDGALRAVL